MDDHIETAEAHSALDFDTQLEEMRTELEGARGAERAAVSRLRDALLAGEPALEAAMLPGETLAEVEANFATATALIGRLRERAALETLARVPAGAPGRAAARPRSAFEKIRDGLGKAS